MEAEQSHNSPEASRERPPPPASYPHPHSHLLDRRSSGQHDHSLYDSQDPRRTPSGPAHGYSHRPYFAPPGAPPSHSPPRQRDPMQGQPVVKRDEPSQPQYKRSPPSPLPHRSGIPSLHRNDSHLYDLPPFEHPPVPAQSYLPPRKSMPAPGPYPARVYTPPGHPRDPYPSVSYPLSSTDVKPKAQRAAQACDSCRTLKAKCDEGRPLCSSCREKGMECLYRDPLPKQQDKTADMRESLMRIEAVLKGIKGDMTRLSVDYTKRLEKVESVRDGLLNAEQHTGVYFKDEGRDCKQSSYSHGPEQLSPQDEDDLGFEPCSDSEEEREGDPPPAKPPTIPINHTTGAARLLDEPVAVGIVGQAPGYRKGKYPISHEGKRGLLRLFGRGEGTDATPGYDRETFADHGSDSTSGDTHSDASSPAPAGDEWGQVGGLTPPGNPPPGFLRGGISQDGMPDFSRETVLQLVKSYKDNMNNMHPIMIPARLDLLVENFLRHLPDSQAKPKQIASLVSGHGGHRANPVAGFLVGSRNLESPGNKRKRSTGDADPRETANYWDQNKASRPFRTIGTALVMLVLALGEICLHRGKIPNLAPDKEPQTPCPSVVQIGHSASPLDSHPPMSAVPSPHIGPQSRSRRASTEGGYPPRNDHSRPKNLDLIPGLAYFAFATDIIGNQLGGNTLPHVHANILAGLYHGQLGRVMDSHTYIHQACRGLLNLLQPKLDRFRGIKLKNGLVTPEDNPLIIAFWTCLQLESDIIAELSLPQSGILRHEEDMPGPNLLAAVENDKFDDLVIESYSAQLYLRKHLNSLHNMFYRPMSTSDKDVIFSAGVAAQNQEPRHFPTIAAAEQSLSYMDRIAPSMIWKVDEGVPATSILDARLRAKFYGAKVITYRPFLLNILRANGNETLSEVRSDEFKDSVVEVPTMKPSVANAGEIDPTIMGYARKCILALVHSTTAFHNVVAEWGKDRLIVTNIWGTAHAQWGNLLTLSMAYTDSILGPVVLETICKEKLQDLLVKTIALLTLVATPTSALLIDAELLKYAGVKTGLLVNEISKA